MGAGHFLRKTNTPQFRTGSSLQTLTTRRLSIPAGVVRASRLSGALMRCTGTITSWAPPCSRTILVWVRQEIRSLSVRLLARQHVRSKLRASTGSLRPQSLWPKTRAGEELTNHLVPIPRLRRRSWHPLSPPCRRKGLHQRQSTLLATVGHCEGMIAATRVCPWTSWWRFMDRAMSKR